MIDASLITVRFLGKQFDRKSVFERIGLSLYPGECLLVTGENGCGKTTLMRILAGLEKPDHGLFDVGDATDRPWRAVRKHLLQATMYLHQQPYMLAGSVHRNLDYAARLNKTIIDRDRAVERSLAWAELDSISDQEAASLSGGQKQRVALARARLRDPHILLLDEPTSNLDRESRARTLEMLGSFQQAGKALVIVTHDPDFFASIATEQMALASTEGNRGNVLDLEKARQQRK